MSERGMSWEEIKAAFPDEYVVLVDFEPGEVVPQVSGRVVAHHRSRREALAAALLPPGTDWALRYTGRVKAAALLHLKCDR